jgi:hypothetical protein
MAYRRSVAGETEPELSQQIFTFFLPYCQTRYTFLTNLFVKEICHKTDFFNLELDICNVMIYFLNIIVIFKGINKPCKDF